MSSGCKLKPAALILLLLAGPMPALRGAQGAMALAGSTRVPISGFQPQVVISLTDEQGEELELFQVASSATGGATLPLGGPAHYGIGLYDSGSAIHLLTSQARSEFDLVGSGFGGTETIPVGGVGQILVTIEDPLGIYVAGLGSITATAPLAVQAAALRGATNVSITTGPPESDLPNIVGLPLASQYMTVIRNDQPHMLAIDGQMVRSPQLQLLPLGSGSAPPITRRAPMQLLPSDGFLSPPFYFPNFDNALSGLPFTDNPSQPTALGGGLFLSVDLANRGQGQSNLAALFDTGATSSVISELVAINLGIDPVLDTPAFTVPVGGAGSTRFDVPGFYVDSLNIDTSGGTFTLRNVPVLVLNLPDPTNPANSLPALLGMNLFNDRNLVLNPQPGNAYLAISDPVLAAHQWASVAPSAAWSSASSWSSPGAPSTLWVTNVVSQAGTAQRALVDANSTVHQMYVAGGASPMAVVVQAGATLSVFGVAQVGDGGRLELEGGRLSASTVELDGGRLGGAGVLESELSNAGAVAPGWPIGRLEITGTYIQQPAGRLEIELGGTADADHDLLAVGGAAVPGGTLDIRLVEPFRPAAGQAFEVLTWRSHSGEFGQVLGRHLGRGLYFDLDYGGDGLTLVATQAPAGDLNLDGAVDAADLAVLVDAFDTLGDHDWLSGDFNADRRVNYGDLALMAPNWSGGGVGATAADRMASVLEGLLVPEPGTAPLLLLGAAALLRRSGRRGAARP